MAVVSPCSAPRSTGYVYVWETIGRGVEEPPDPRKEGPGLARARLGVVSLAKISVIGMLVAASVIRGFGTPFGLVILVLLARDHSVMGTRPISGLLARAGWAVAVVVGGFGLLVVV